MSRRVEEPRHDVLQKDGSLELRSYAPRVLAETRVGGSRDQAANEGFRRLAGYIFGANRARTKVAMTAPVAQRETGQTMAMTAPVGQKQSNDEWTVSFTMPAAFTLDTLPVPNDSRVALREQPAARVAAVRFSGRTTPARIAEETSRLQAWVREHGWSVRTAPEVNRYDPPWTLPFLRRNEIWIALD